jgi:hypothetical protein
MSDNDRPADIMERGILPGADHHFRPDSGDVSERQSNPRQGHEINDIHREFQSELEVRNQDFTTRNQEKNELSRRRTKVRRALSNLIRYRNALFPLFPSVNPS